MTKTWQDHWDEAADDEYRSMEERPLSELLADAGSGRFGSYYTIWRVIGRKAALAEAGWVLFAVLEGEADYLHRYHCAGALLELLRNIGMEPVDLSADHKAKRENLARLRRQLVSRIGEPDKVILPGKPG